MCHAASVLSLTMAEVIWRMSLNVPVGGTDGQIITMSVVILVCTEGDRH